MLTRLEGMPANVIGFEARGEISGEDYRSMVAPALAAAEPGGDVRLLLVIPEKVSMSGGAAWEGFKTGVNDSGSWKRFAVVSDDESVAWFSDLFDKANQGEVKVFPLAQRDAAAAWVVS